MPASSIRTAMPVACLLLAMAGLSAGVDAIEVPELVNFQGKLTDASGNPRNDTLTMTFRIYDDSSGGRKYWEETQDQVEVLDGLFHVLLGSVVPLVPGTSLPPGPDCWFEVEVAGQPAVPRTRMASVPYAHGAQKAEDVSQKGATTGQVLKWSGTAWMPGADEGGNVTYGTFSKDFTTLNGRTVYNLTILFAPGTGPKAGDYLFVQFDTLWPWQCITYNTGTVPVDDQVVIRTVNQNTTAVDPPLCTWRYIWVHNVSLDRVGRAVVLKQAWATEAGRLE